jgi:peptide/nickel transport system substrate-binding protein
VRRPPFDDATVRRGFSLGVNYESLAKNVMDGVFDTATGFYSTSFAWAIQNQKTDTEAAKRLLDEAGWQTGAGGIRSKNNSPLEAVFLVYPQQPDWTTLATAMQAQLREIGFDLKIRQVDDINQAMKNTRDWSLAINSPGILSSGGAPDPSLKEHFAVNGERNFGGISDAELDRLIEELSRSFDAAKRAELLRRIQQIVIEEKAYEVRPVFVRSRVVVGNKFRDYKPSPQLRYVTYDTRPADN